MFNTYFTPAFYHYLSNKLRKMKKFLILFFALIALSASADSAHLKEYVLNLGQFDKIRVDDNVNVVYRQNPDSTGCASFRSTEEFADAFIFTVNNGTLRVQVTTEDVGKEGLPTLNLFSDFLTSITSSSDFEVRVADLAPCPELKVNLIGNGTITVDDIRATKLSAKLSTGNGTLNLSGSVQEATFSMIGTGTIQADRLRSGKVNCHIMGSGTIGCWPLDKLCVKGIGSTKIYYKGEPKVKKNGGGKLFQIPEDDYASAD